MLRSALTRRWLWVFVAVLCLTAAPSAVLAHGMEVSAWRDGGEIVVAAKWSGGGAVKDAAVTLFDDDKTVLAEGWTDSSGEFAWAVAETPRYLRVEVDAGDGHKGTRIFTRQDVKAAKEPARRVSTWTVLVGVFAIFGGTWLLAGLVRREKKVEGE